MVVDDCRCPKTCLARNLDSIVNLSSDLGLCSHSLVTVMHACSERKRAPANGGIGRSNGRA
jgi:hypothetical protein